MSALPKTTRFRGYRLEDTGGSYSYFDGEYFTLIEARLMDSNRDSIINEMGLCGVSNIDCLHITSWDNDHCRPNQLAEILELFSPKKIEYPGYTPHTDSGKNSLKIIHEYKEKQPIRKVNLVSVTPQYIKELKTAKELKYQDVIYNPLSIETQNSNDKSTIKLFRSGSFNVLSLGDVESNNIASLLREKNIIKKEVDVMIMAHHGADNGFTTNEFLKRVAPKVAIVGSNYANKYDHPKKEIKDMLYENEIRLYTTKTGDIIISSYGDHTGKYKAENYITGGTVLNSTQYFISKKRPLLKMNDDTLSSSKRYRKNRII